MPSALCTKLKAALGAAIVASLLLSPAATSTARAQQPAQAAGPALVVTPAANQTQVQWRVVAADLEPASAATTHLPLVPYAGAMLPMQTLAVRVEGGVAPAALPSHLVDAPWPGPLPAVDALLPPALDWEPRPWQTPPADAPLPSAPLFLLREGRLRGAHIAVYAFSEIYQDPSGALRRVLELDAAIPGSLPLADALLLSSEPSGVLDSQAQPEPASLVAPPVNALAGRSAVKVFVAQSGIQRISAADLASAGLTGPAAGKLRLYHRDTEVALQVFDNNRDGTLAGNDESFRFYAPAPGDVWNSEDVYWLVEETVGGLRMAPRGVAPQQAPRRDTALETGVWRLNQIYESTVPGADGDNWFHLEGDLSAATTLADAPSFSADLGLRLPPAANVAEKSVFTLSVSVTGPVTAAPLALRVQAGGGTVAYTDGPGDWVVDFSRGSVQNFSRRIESDGRATALTVQLLPPAQPAAQSSAVFFDDIAWQQPVRLNLNGHGAAFRGVAGTWRYQVSGAPAGAWLYDVSDPRRPQTLATAAAANFEFQDGPAAHGYVIAGEGTLHTPRLQAHNAIALGKGADALYIAPQIFHAALQPLVELRTRQGYQVQVVDVQDIYNAWSYGAMDPQAIRNFLRYAVSAWQPSPISAVLVGDGTWDPRNYLATGNPTHIPPYLADVDPWLRVTACEFCYAQLDFDEPLQDSLIDIWLGRFPVADAVELAAVVDKIVRYESAVDPAAPWRSLSVQMADDYVESPDGALDRAGNFWKLVESVIKQQPSLLTIARVYYNVAVDPAVLDPATRQWYEAVRPWLQTSESAAQTAARRTLSAGAGLVTFTGHANHWQWARMGPVSGYDHRLFGLLDVGGLANRDAPFIGLAMTCYSSQFTIPERATHTTLDERLFLHPNGGAVAMWGPAGLSIAYGHDVLQTGFYRALWRARPLQAKLGALTQSGYNAIVLDTPCCQDVARTFVFMGDPLTPARVQPLASVRLPWVSASTAAGEPAFRLRLPWVTTSRP